MAENASRFFERVFPEPNTGCFIWSGPINRKGYGHLKFKDGDLTLHQAHRVAYYLRNGPFDYSLFVCHKCDNPTCVNPDHLFLGTLRDNLMDSINKGRAFRGKRNTKLNKAQVLEVRQKYQTSLYTYPELAKEYGVTKHCICNIILRRNWKMLP